MITTPSIPMRPQMGVKLTADNVLYEVAKMKAKGYIVQRKLNGDRGVLEMTRLGLLLWNRYGSLYSASGVDLAAWNTLPLGTVLDGEVYLGEFYPFEVINDKLQEQRITDAEAMCRRCGQPYIFGGITNDWLIGEVTLDDNPKTRMWEGVVCKLAGAKYVPLKKPDHESPTWQKCKWC